MLLWAVNLCSWFIFSLKFSHQNIDKTKEKNELLSTIMTKVSSQSSSMLSNLFFPCLLGLICWIYLRIRRKQSLFTSKFSASTIMNKIKKIAKELKILYYVEINILWHSKEFFFYSHIICYICVLLKKSVENLSEWLFHKYI